MTDTERTFTASEVDDLIARRLGQEKRTSGAKAKELQDKLAEYEQDNASLRESVERLQGQLERANAQHEDIAQKHAVAEEQIKAERERSNGVLSRHYSQQALVAAGGHDKALADAVDMMARAVQFEIGADGAPTAVSYEGREFPTLDAAATAFLDARPWFAKAPPGGPGIPPPTGGPGPAPKPRITEADSNDLARRALENR